MFEPGVSILDQDGDGFSDRVALRLIVPDSPTASEMALASDIAARANLESLLLEFGMVRKESDEGELRAGTQTLFIGPNLKTLNSLIKASRLSVPKFPEGLSPFPD
jgi:hypothetical protein